MYIVLSEQIQHLQPATLNQLCPHSSKNERSCVSDQIMVLIVDDQQDRRDEKVRVIFCKPPAGGDRHLFRSSSGILSMCPQQDNQAR